MENITDLLQPHDDSEEELLEELFGHTIDRYQMVLIVCELILAVVIVTGNAFVLALFYQERKCHHISHKYIISMAVSDLMQGIFTAPFIIYLTFGVTVASNECLYALMGGTSFALSSLVIIVATSVDRYWAICHPFSYKAHSTSKIAAGKS